MLLEKIIAKCLPHLKWAPEQDLSLLPQARTKEGLWVDPVEFLRLINAWSLALWALRLSQVLCPWALPAPKRGRPPIYSDVSVFLTSIVAGAWRLSYEGITDWLARYEALALALGYDQRDEYGRLKTISLAQYSRRVRNLGLLPYFLFFIALVAALIRLGLIKGYDLIIDSSLLQAWYKDDPDARWSYPNRRKGSIFGYKIHSIICRWSYLPVFFVITPANINDGSLAIPMLAATVLLYGFQVLFVRADAAYFNHDFLGFIKEVLHASPIIDYNLRRKGKKFLATLFFLHQWREATRPRSNIERTFAWLKRYFGLKDFQVQGIIAVTRYAFQVHIAMLAVAVIAARYQRPELATSRSKVLAFTR